MTWNSGPMLDGPDSSPVPLPVTLAELLDNTAPCRAAGPNNTWCMRPIDHRPSDVHATLGPIGDGKAVIVCWWSAGLLPERR